MALRRIKNNYKKKRIRVGFVGYLDGPSCDVFSELYRCFSRDTNFECKNIIVPYTHDFKDKMISKQRIAFDYLKSIGIDAYLGYDEESDKFNDYSNQFDIVFFEIEYDWVNPLFRTENFKNALTFIIPYGQYLADNIWTHMSYKMMSEVYCIFPTSVAVQKMMKNYSTVWGINVCEKYLGNPKIDRFFNMDNKTIDVWKKAKPGQKRIIWAPHHTWAEYSNFHKYSEFMLQFAEERKDDLFIAIKPHPALKDSLKGVNNWTDSEVNSYFEKWRNGANTDLFEGEWYDLFMTSDAMIMDSIGFMLEYSLTGKPACVLYKLNEEGERLMKFSECGEQVFDLLYKAKDQHEIETFVTMLKENKDPKKSDRIQYIENNYRPPFERFGYENIYNYLIETINRI